MLNEELKNILVVDDEKYICNIIDEALAEFKDCRVVKFDNPQNALDYISENSVDLVLSDLVMGDFSGVQILEHTLENHPDAIVILMTGYPTVKTAISVLKKGGYDYLTKPFKLEDLKATIRRGLERQRIKRDNVELKSQLELMKVAREYSRGIKLQPLLNLVVESAVSALPASSASIMLKSGSSDNFHLKGMAGDIHGEKENVFIRGHSKAFADILSTRKAHIIHDELEIEGKSYKRSFVSHPMLSHGNIIGLLNVIYISRFSYISSGQRRMISLLVSTAASAVESNALNRNLKKSYYQTIKTLANAIEARDRYTAGHTDRVYRIARVIARKMGWSLKRLMDLRTGCLLHDIGKIGVPDSILNKPDKLDDYERNIMMKHPEMGARILEGIPFLEPIIPYVLYHHEQFDGSGYPFGLKGKEIPVEGRLLAVVDTFDAMTSDRPYRKGLPASTALAELRQFSGSQFDPDIVELFCEIYESGQIRSESHRNGFPDYKEKILSPSAVSERA